MKVPFANLALRNTQFLEGFIEDLKFAVDRSEFILGESLVQFEQEFAKFCGAKFAIGVANGTDALEIALRSVDLGEDAEVIVPSNSFVASAAGVSRAGLSPIFCDSDQNFMIDLQSARRVVGPNTKAIMAVSLYGQMPNVREILEFAKEFNLVVIEDGAQSQGATNREYKSGNFATISCTSFYPGKNLGALGDAGAITTNDPTLAARCRAIRNYGSEEKYEHPEFGFNSRLDVLQARFLSRKLRWLDEDNTLRNKIANTYFKRLHEVNEIELPMTLEGNRHVWHLYVIRTMYRDELRSFLDSRGIQTGLHYPKPIHLQSAYKDCRRDSGMERVTHDSAQILSLPIFAGMDQVAANYVADSIIDFFGQKKVRPFF